MSSKSTNTAVSPSSCESPDLDWSQMRETVMMLNLGVAQIGASMKEGDDSVRSLTDSFTFMASVLHSINVDAARLPDTEDVAEIKEVIQDNCRAVTGMVQASIIAFQFYDKLGQRLEHVAESMSGMASLVADSSRLYNPREWQGLQEYILSRYSMREETAIYEAVRSGISLEDAMNELMAAAAAETPSDDDEIELF